MRFYIVLSIIIVNFILQSTIFQYFRILGVLPNTALLIVIVFSILWGEKKGAVIGFITGLLQDILVGSFVGINALIYMLIAYNIGNFQKILFKDTYLTPVFFAIISTSIYHVSYYSVMYMTNNPVEFLIVFKNIVLPETIYNGIVSVVIYRWIYNLTRKSYMKEKIRGSKC
ncbi:rod shape-determining protein MreD [Lutibacter sp. B2]|nr:rod shape-determining protein MreD [Lutibacter sp. B2]